MHILQHIVGLAGYPMEAYQIWCLPGVGLRDEQEKLIKELFPDGEIEYCRELEALEVYLHDVIVSMISARYKQTKA